MELATTLLLAALKGAASYAGKRATEQVLKTVADQSFSLDERAIRIAIGSLPPDRQEAGRLALTDWMGQLEWQSGAFLSKLEAESQVTAAMITTVEKHLETLEQTDRPRVVAQIFLAAYWTALVSDQGSEIMLAKQKQLLDVGQDIQLNLGQVSAKIDLLFLRTEQPDNSFHPTNPQLPDSDPHADALKRIAYSLEDAAFGKAQQRLEDLKAKQADFTDSAWAKYLRLWGNLENALGHAEKAAEYYIQAFEYDSTSTGGLAMRGYAAVLQNQPEQALVYLERALKKGTRSDWACPVFA